MTQGDTQTDSTISPIAADVAIVGWGKGGKTLAAGLAKAGKRVVVIEQSAMMAGGTCINIGCVPTKALVHQADIARTLRLAGDLNGTEDLNAQFTTAVNARDALIDKLRGVNHAMLAELDQVTLVGGRARVLSVEGKADARSITIEVTSRDDDQRVLVTASTLVLNTGSVPMVPASIDGLEDIAAGQGDIALQGHAEMGSAQRGVYTSTTIQHASPRPQRLVIVGSGFIALEFASMFAGFGSKVTVLNRSAHILGREDAPVRDSVRGVLEGDGIRFVDECETLAVTGSAADGTLSVRVRVRGEEREIAADGVLVATGRRPATDNLGLAEVGVMVGARGEVVVDDVMRTSVEGIFAIGDVNGGPQNTYISLDDFRIVKDQLVGSGARSRSDRVAVASTTFVTPPLSMVGLTEREAREAGYEVLVVHKPVAAVKAMPRPKTLGDPRGIISIVVDKGSDLILGARLFHVDSQEVINLIALAMRAGVSASELREGIWTHPSSTEALNEVLAELVPSDEGMHRPAQ